MAIISPFAGVIVDRLNRKLVLIASDAITAACMLVIIWLFSGGKIELWQIYCLMAIRATMQAFQQPAAKACLVHLVPESFIPRAAGLNQAMEGIMVIGAAPLGALVLSLLPLQGALLIDVITAACGILPLFFIPLPRPEAPSSGQGGLAAFGRDFREGAGHVAGNKGLLYAFILDGLVTLIIMPAYSLIPLFVKKALGGGLTEVAVMELLAGIGLIGGGLAVSLLGPRVRKMSFVLASFGLSCALLALTAVLARRQFALVSLCWALSACLYSMGNAPFLAILQSTVPQGLQGRVFSLLTAVVTAASPLGLAIEGGLAESIGVRALFIGAGTCATLPYILALFSPSILGLGGEKERRAAEDEGTEPTREAT
jgi:DHA3 family macrolide efflux protein-like MFS transporter